MSVQFLNPDGLHKSPVFSWGVVIPAGSRIVLIGGQNGVDRDGQVVDKGDLGKQTERALANMALVLAEAGAGIGDLVSVGVHLAQGHDPMPGVRAWMQAWGNRPNPPVVKVLTVASFANPDVLVEIDGQAVLA